MALVRYNPWQEMNSLQRQLNRLFDDALHLKLEVPGMEAKDLDIQVTAEQIAIAGERKSETKSEENGRTRLCGAVSFRTEFRYGKFSRVIPLPVRIQNTNVTAEYKDGILNLTLPKSEEEKNKVVKVNLDEAGE